MTSILDINEKEAAGKLGLINKYLTIILLLVFGTGIFYLYIGQTRLNDRLFNYMENDNKNSIRTIQENKSAIENNTDVLREIKMLMSENRVILKQSK